jgi:hypothetical protein
MAAVRCSSPRPYAAHGHGSNYTGEQELLARRVTHADLERARVRVGGRRCRSVSQRPPRRSHACRWVHPPSLAHAPPTLRVLSQCLTLSLSLARMAGGAGEVPYQGGCGEAQAAGAGAASGGAGDQAHAAAKEAGWAQRTARVRRTGESSCPLGGRRRKCSNNALCLTPGGTRLGR